MSQAAAGPRFKPQELLLSLGGALVLDLPDGPVPTRVFLEVLGALGISSDTTRTALARLTERGLLTRHQDGRVGSYGLTEASRRLLEEGRERVRAAAPFHQDSSEWTLLSFSLPEARRDVRNRLRSRLAWAGFGCVRDGLWIAPGIVDLERIVSFPVDDEELQIDGFVVQPAPGTDVGRLVRRAWDLDALRRAHEDFASRWQAPPAAGADPVACYTALGAHWIRLLRQDPALPAQYLDDDWPASRSSTVYWQVARTLEPRAQAAFADLVAWARTRR
jgi:phenylacetic acid degradation operon negative regulatory protein